MYTTLDPKTTSYSPATGVGSTEAGFTSPNAWRMEASSAARSASMELLANNARHRKIAVLICFTNSYLFFQNIVWILTMIRSHGSGVS
jgi:hypothetical protein